jgi:hypothetical protein
MKRALKMMQEMQAFLAERGIQSHVDITFCYKIHSCQITVWNDSEIFAKCDWADYKQEDFEPEWAKFEKKVQDEFFGWWE